MAGIEQILAQVPTQELPTAVAAPVVAAPEVEAEIEPDVEPEALVGFDPEGEKYDYMSAVAAKKFPGRGKQWCAVLDATPEQIKEFGLPKKACMVLKGRKHPTWAEAEAAERARGFEIKKFGNRYYSVPMVKTKPVVGGIADVLKQMPMPGPSR